MRSDRLIHLAFFSIMKLPEHELCYIAAGANILRPEQNVNSDGLEDLIIAQMCFAALL